jgi:DNA-binding NarL/FixJ family response regulator
LSSFSAAVLIVDAAVGERNALGEVLSRLGCVVRPASTGVEALLTAQDRKPDAVIADVRLPDMTGYELCQDLRVRFGEELPIVLMSADRTEASDRIAALLLGADDYFPKPVPIGELLARMRRLLARTPPRLASDRGANLTSREAQVLSLLAEGYGQGQIADELVISPKTVGTHIQRILEKLEVHSRAEAVAVAHRHGLVRPAQRSAA